MNLSESVNRKWKAFLLVIAVEGLITLALGAKYVFSGSEGILGALISAFSAMNVTFTTYVTLNVVQKKVTEGNHDRQN